MKPISHRQPHLRLNLLSLFPFAVSVVFSLLLRVVGANDPFNRADISSDVCDEVGDTHAFRYPSQPTMLIRIGNINACVVSLIFLLRRYHSTCCFS
ncbi:hypothetical protein Hypma_010883 [Hypsizygus marmoreus]|uniref:Uncharacterized protein n=1 Tax=Hypsizygus marmoreus TaxID=39966 RepID=A0A369JJF0_HYPMA|nr:hypothetical protein Hypma_010883 [Hypsizygus marmoreus]